MISVGVVAGWRSPGWRRIGGMAMVAFGDYEVLGPVASGSTGTVWKALHPQLKRTVAIKELSAELRSQPGFLERFRAEARILAGLDDPHVVAVFDYVEEPGRAWIVQEWVDGASIEAVLAGHGRLSPEQSLGVLRGALLGLGHAHDRALVHRDVKPANILADQAGTSRLVDFGLAAPVGAAGAAGTPAYMSPEAARGAALDTRSDVYSAGAVLFELLNGNPPYAAPDLQAMLARHISAPVPALRGHGSLLADLLGRVLAKDPAQRPADARAFLAELEEAATDRYGAGWLARASIAGVIASTAGIAVASTAAGGAAAGGSPITAATVILGGREAASRAARAHRAARNPRIGSRRVWKSVARRPAVAAAVIAGAVLITATSAAAVVRATRTDPGRTTSAGNTTSPGMSTPTATPTPTATASATPSPTASATPSPTAPAVIGLNGTWTVRGVITRYEGFSGAAPGKAHARTWTFSGDCVSGACPVTVRGKGLSAGTPFSIVLTPKSGQYTLRESQRSDCIDDKTGAVRVKNGGLYTIVETLRVTPPAAGADPAAPAAAFTMDIRGDFRPNAAGRAKNCRAGHLREKITGTRA